MSASISLYFALAHRCNISRKPVHETYTSCLGRFFSLSGTKHLKNRVLSKADGVACSKQPSEIPLMRNTKKVTFVKQKNLEPSVDHPNTFLLAPVGNHSVFLSIIECSFLL